MVDDINTDGAPVTENAPVPAAPEEHGNYTINTVPEADHPTPINLQDPMQPATLTDDGMNQRAALAHYALQDKSPGLAAAKGIIQSGGEPAMRRQASFDQLNAQQDAAYSVIKQVAGVRGGILSPQEQEAVMSLAKTTQDSNPSTVFEKMWASNYVKELLHTPSPAVKDGMSTSPGRTLSMAGHTDQLVTKDRIVNTIGQEFDKRYDDMPWSPIKKDGYTGWTRTTAYLTSQIPFYSTYLKYGTGMSYDPGHNMNDQVDFYYLMNPDHFEAAVRQHAEELYSKSPDAAMDFLQAMRSRPNMAASVDNLFAVADVAAVWPGALVARGGRAAASAAAKVVGKAEVAVDKAFVEASRDISIPAKQADRILDGYAVQLQKGETGYKTPFIRLKEGVEAFPESGGYTPSLNTQNSPAGFLEAPGGIQGTYTQTYRIGEDRHATQGRDLFVDPAELSKLPEGSRLYKPAEGDGLRVTQKVEGKGWQPTRETIATSPEPQAGMVRLDLGEPKNSMGTRYWDNYKVSAPVTALEGRTITPVTGDNIASQMVGSEATKTRLEGRIKTTTQIEKLRTELEGTEADLHVAVAQGNMDVVKGIEAKQEVLKKNISEATEERSKVSTYTGVPAYDRADQNMKAYLASGFKALGPIPSQAGSGFKSDLQNSLTILGRVEDAAKQGAFRKMDDLTVNADDPAKIAEGLSKDLPSTHRPNPFVANPSELSRELTQRRADGMLEGPLGKKLTDAISTAPRVQTQSLEDLEASYNATRSSQLDKYSLDFNNSILNYRPLHDSYNPTTNTYHVQALLGKTDGTLFETEASAINTARDLYKLPLQDFHVEGNGNAWHIVADNPVREDSFINKEIPTNNLTPRSPVNVALGAARSAEDTTSEVQRSARHVATHAPQNLKAILQSVVDTITLSKPEKNEMRMILNQSRVDPDASGKMGTWYDRNKLETLYQTRFGKVPSEQFTSAYYTYKLLNDFDFNLRKQGVYKTIIRWGGENMQFKVFDGKGGVADTPTFIGRKVDDLSGQTGWFSQSVLLSDEKGVKSYTTKQIKADPTLEATINGAIKSGYDVIQLFRPLKKELAESTGNAGDHYYVITNSLKRSNLQVGDGLEYRGGPHHAYTFEHFSKQPQMVKSSDGQDVYAGDKTFMAVGSSEAEGRAWNTKIETARNLMNAGDDAALDAHLRQNLPWSVDEWKKFFTGDNAMDPNTPFVYTKGGTNAFQSNPELFSRYGENLKNYINDLTNPESGLNASYIQERANQPLMMLRDLGPDAPARFTMDTSNFLDPFITLNRALGQAVRSRFMDDYKVLAAESFIKEFGRYIPGVTPEALQRNPVHFVYNAKIDTGTTDKTTSAAFRQFQTNVKNFIGMRSQVGEAIDFFEGKMENLLYSKLGSEKTASILSNSTVQNVLIPAIKDPFLLARSAAFHYRLGLFNPLQTFVQAQTAAMAIAQSPVHGLTGAQVASYMATGGRYALDNPAAMDRYATMIARTTSLSKDDAIEAMNAYKASGVSRVAGETAWRDDFMDPKFFQSKLGNFLDAGTMFFQLGERFNRDTAYFTAFKEWKTANPVATLDQYSMGKIMNRFDQLSGNMTRASNSSLQTGPLSPIFQFYTFTQRQAEQFFSSRVTTQEKMRMFAMYSALYGLPVAASSVVPWPFYDSIRAKAIDMGVDVHSDYFRLMHEGLMSTMFTKLTGKETDMATRFGPNANNLIKDVWDSISGDGESSKTIGQIAFGPSGTVVADSFRALYPFARAAYSRVVDPENKYPVRIEDFAGLFSDISTLNNAEKWWAAYNVQKYFSKNGRYLGDVNGWDGFLMFTMGLTPREFSDGFLKQATIKGARTLQESASKDMQTAFQRGVEAYSNGDTSTGDQYLARANYLAKMSDMRPDQIGDVFAKSGGGFTSMMDSIKNPLNDPRASSAQKYIDNLNKGKQ